MIKFFDAVKVKTSSCAICNSVMYILPCQINVDIVNYLTSFGKPQYPINSVSLLKIDAGGGFRIEGKIGSKQIKFVMPKQCKNKKYVYEKSSFEACLAKWLAKTLGIVLHF